MRAAWLLAGNLPLSPRVTCMPRRASKAPPGVPPKGVYANYFEVGQTAFEFVIDFGQQYRGQTPAACHTRIVTSPTYARALLETLSQAVDDYSKRFGKDT